MIPTLTLERAQTILQAMAGKKLALLGDLMLDEYIWGEVRRISPEAPIPVVEVRRRSYLPGGAGNVACNLLALGVQAAVVAVVGDDEAGRELLRELSDRKADIEGIIIEAGRPTTHKSRVMAHRQQVVRIDREVVSDTKAEIAEKLRAALQKAMTTCGGALVADYDKGVISPITTGDLADLAKQGCPVCVDPKPQNIGLFRGVTLISPNEDEALRASHQSDYRAAGNWLLDNLQVEAALVTLGPRGMSLFRAKHELVELGTFAAEDSVGDSTGCGDTVSAVFAATLAAGGSFEEAMVLANCGAGITAGRVGVHAPTPEEILTALQAQERFLAK